MSWTANNRAHTSLWGFEIWHHDRTDEQFIPAGEWEVDFMAKIVAGDSPQMRANKVKTHASMLDSVFISLNRAKYEEGITRESAIAAMSVVLADSAKKMKDLGDVVDACYKFHGEV